MNKSKRIYLDNAATSWPKPDVVYEAVDRYQREIGAPAGRSSYQEAGDAAQLVESTRRQLAELLHADDTNRVLFTYNGTDSLNMALHGLLRAGDHVVTSVVEHNSVLRPLRFLEESRTIEVTRVACGQRGAVDPDALLRSIRPNTRLIALVHASNVTGALQPVSEVGKIARQNGILFLVDAAQSLGHIPLDVHELQCDLLASSGHKGLLGPLGTGVLYMAPGMEDCVNSFRLGGTGTQSEEDRQPAWLPDKFESGNLNMPGLAGLEAALKVLRMRGIENVREHERQLTAQLLDGLRGIAGVTIYGPRDSSLQVGVVSINLSGYDPQEIAAVLDVASGVQVRAGLHCAPRMHQALNTVATGGTVRFSVGIFNDAWQIDQAISAVAQLARSSPPTAGA